MPLKIVQIRPLDDCIGDLITKEVIFNSPITENLIKYLSSEGELEYHASFARPFFRMDIPGAFILKGIQGRTSARLILDRDNIENSLTLFRAQIDSYSQPLPLPPAT